MQEHKRRPTLEEMKEMPDGLLRMEVAQLCVDATIAGCQEVLTDAEAMLLNVQLEPEAIVELWTRLRQATYVCPRCGAKGIAGYDTMCTCASGSTIYESPSDNEPNQALRRLRNIPRYKR
jgi:hypothetical protein